MQDLEDQLVKMDRLETVLSDKVAGLATSQKALARGCKELTLEVEELKSLRHSFEQELPATLAQSLDSHIQQLLPKIITPVVQAIREQTAAQLKGAVQEAQTLSTAINQSVNQATQFLTAQKQVLARRNLLAALSFSVGSLLTSAVIYWYFPQQVTYTLNRSTALSAVVGEIFLQHYDRLSPQQKDFFDQKFKEQIQLSAP